MPKVQHDQGNLRAHNPGDLYSIVVETVVFFLFEMYSIPSGAVLLMGPAQSGTGSPASTSAQRSCRVRVDDRK